MRKAILVGAGGMGRSWARNLKAHGGVDIVAWVDVRPGVAAQAAEEEDIAVGHTDLDIDEALKLDCEFVVDVTSPESHHAVTLAALAAGKHVIGEKPMSDSMAKAREMVQASEQAGRLFMVSQSRRYYKGMAALKGIIGNLGALGILNVDFYRGPRFGGFRDRMPSPLIVDMAIHTFDQARFLTGVDPASVYAEEFNPSWSWYAGDACANALFEMEGGVRFHYRGGWCADGFETSWNSQWRAIGAKGTAVWDGSDVPEAELSDGSRIVPDVPAIAEDIAGSLRDFLHALDTGEKPDCECHDNIKSLAMVDAAVRSAKSGVRTKVSW